MLSSVHPAVEQSAVDAVRVPLQDRTLPNRFEDVTGARVTETSNDILNDLHVGEGAEEGSELFVRRLEDAERRILCGVDDLDVLHEPSVAADTLNVRNRRLSDLQCRRARSHGAIRVERVWINLHSHILGPVGVRAALLHT